MVLELSSGGERVIERGLVLDAAFSPDGRAVYYSSAAGGDLARESAFKSLLM